MDRTESGMSPTTPQDAESNENSIQKNIEKFIKNRESMLEFQKGQLEEQNVELEDLKCNLEKFQDILRRNIDFLAELENYIQEIYEKLCVLKNEQQTWLVEEQKLIDQFSEHLDGQLQEQIYDLLKLKKQDDELIRIQKSRLDLLQKRLDKARTNNEKSLELYKSSWDDRKDMTRGATKIYLFKLKEIFETWFNEEEASLDKKKADFNNQKDFVAKDKKSIDSLVFLIKVSAALMKAKDPKSDEQTDSEI